MSKKIKPTKKSAKPKAKVRKYTTLVKLSLKCYFVRKYALERLGESAMTAAISQINTINKLAIAYNIALEQALSLNYSDDVIKMPHLQAIEHEIDTQLDHLNVLLFRRYDRLDGKRSK